MKNLVLVRVLSGRWGTDEVVEVKLDVKVSSYEEVVKYVVDNMIEDYEEWMEVMLDWFGVESEEDVLRNLIEGDFNDKWFNLGIGEEEGVLCVERGYYDSMREKFSDLELFDEFIGSMY